MQSDLSARVRGVMGRELGGIGENILEKQCYELAILPTDISERELPRLTNQLTEAMVLFTGEDKAREVAKELMTFLRKDKKDKQHSSQWLMEVGDVHKSMGSLEGALKYYGQALKAARNERDTGKEADILRHVASVKRRQGKWGSAIEQLNLALSIDKDNRDPASEVKTLRCLGKAHWAKSDYGRAQAFFEQTITLSLKINSRLTLADAYLDLGTMFDEKGEHEKAIDCFKESIGAMSLGILDGEVKEMTIPRLYIELGTAYCRSGDIEEAIKAYEQALERSKGYAAMHAWALSKLGVCYAKQGCFEKGITACDRAHEVFTTYDDRMGQAGVSMSYAMVYWSGKDYARAAKHFIKCIGLNEIIGTPFRIADARMQYGLMLKELGDKEGAQRQLLRGQKIFQKLENRRMALDIVRQLED